MTIEQRGEFAEWLVPARNDIQSEMLRLRKFLIALQDNKSLAEWRLPDKIALQGWLIGAAFSLWRAAFQARKPLGRDANMAAGLNFLDNIILDNMATFGTELNSWSLAYYLNNARFRLLDARGILAHNGFSTNDLDSAMKEMDTALRGDHETPMCEWRICFSVLRKILDIVAK